MTSRSHRRTLVGLSALSAVAAAGATGLVGVTPAVGAPQHHAHVNAKRFSYSADAYGSMFMDGSSIKSGPSSPAPLPCLAKLGARRSNHAAKATPQSEGQVGAARTHSASRRLSPSAVESLSYSRVSPLNLFGGELQAKSIRSAATERYSAKNGFRPTASTTIVGLVIDGKKQAQHPKKNQKYSLPGVGTLTLNHQTRSASDGTHSVAVDGMLITASKSNTAGLPGGATTTIAHSNAALRAPSKLEVHGVAIGSESAAPGNGSTGPSFEAHLSCDGTNGKTISHSFDASSKPGTASSGTFTSSVEGLVKGKHASATTRERIEGAKLMSGVVGAKTVVARAHVKQTASGLTRNAKGSGFRGLHVSGAPAIGDKVKPNTKRTLPGIGTLYLRRVTKTKRGIEVRMIELVLSSAQNGLPKGSTITMGVAKARTSH